MLREMFWLEKYPESIQTKKIIFIYAEVKEENVLWKEYFETVYLSSSGNVFFSTYKEGSESAPHLWQAAAGKGCLFTGRLDAGVRPWSSCRPNWLSWYALYREIVCKIPFLSRPKYQTHRFFFLESTMEPLFLSWLEMKGKASKCSDPQMSLVWMG